MTEMDSQALRIGHEAILANNLIRQGKRDEAHTVLAKAGLDQLAFIVDEAQEFPAYLEEIEKVCKDARRYLAEEVK